MNTETYVTKEYLDEKFEKFDKKLDKKFDEKIELLKIELKQHTADLVSGFNEKVKGVCDQVTSLDEKLTRVENGVIDVDHKVTRIGADVFNIKNTIKEKTDKKDTLELKRRVIRLEHKIA